MTRTSLLREYYETTLSADWNGRRFSTFQEFLADHCRTLRSTYDLSQADLASGIGVSVTAVQHWESYTGTRGIAPGNQERLLAFEREQWMNKYFPSEYLPCSRRADIRAIYELLRARKDKVACDLALYLLAILRLSDADRATLHYVCALCFWLHDGHGINVKIHCDKSLRLLQETSEGVSEEATDMLASIHNIVIGLKVAELLRLPSNSEQRIQSGSDAIEELSAMFDVYQRPGFLWNALGIACNVVSSEPCISTVLRKLVEEMGVDTVRDRISSDERFAVPERLLRLENVSMGS